MSADRRFITQNAARYTSVSNIIAALRCDWHQDLLSDKSVYKSSTASTN